MSGDKAYQDYETMYDLYVEQELSAYEIADQMPVTPRTINTWLHQLDIPVRDKSESKIIAGRRYHLPSFETYSLGYERWETFYKDERFMAKVHRLLAVAEYGFDAVKDKHVHHKNGIPWDNRADNIELVTPAEHREYHPVTERREDGTAVSVGLVGGSRE